jgi:hypothetical protein
MERRLTLRRKKPRAGLECAAEEEEGARDLADEGLEGQLTVSSSGIDCGVVTTIPWLSALALVVKVVLFVAAAARSPAHVVSPALLDLGDDAALVRSSPTSSMCRVSAEY